MIRCGRIILRRGRRRRKRRRRRRHEDGGRISRALDFGAYDVRVQQPREQGHGGEQSAHAIDIKRGPRDLAGEHEPGVRVRKK